MSFRLGSLRIRVGYVAAAALTAALLLDREGRITCCLFAAALHELGHLLMMLLCRTKVRGIQLGLFDVRIDAGRPDTVAGEVAVTLGGPMMNLLLAGVFAPLSRDFCCANLALGLFNLLPVLSLDGGRLTALMLTRRLSPRGISRVMRALTFLTALPLMTAGVWILLRSGYNYSLLIVSLYLLAILFLKPDGEGAERWR